MAFLKAGKKEKFEMLAQKEPAIKKAYGVLKKLSTDERTGLLYESREKAWMDNESRMAGALKQGIEQDIEQGAGQKVVQIIKKLHAMQMSIEDISEATELPIDKVKSVLDALGE